VIWCVAAASVVHAEGLSVLGKTFMVRDPAPGSDPSRRSVVVLGKEARSDDVVVGNPIAAGATIELTADGDSPTTQTVRLPPGPPDATSAGWKMLGTSGYSYADPFGTNGPVASASIRRTGTGTFLLKLELTGRGAGPQPRVTLLPPAPGVTADLRFTIGDGDTYCVSFGGAAGGAVTADGAQLFKIAATSRAPTTRTGCPVALSTTTTSPATTSTTATSISATTTSTTGTSTTTLCVLTPGSPCDPPVRSVFVLPDGDSDAAETMTDSPTPADLSEPSVPLTGSVDAVGTAANWIGWRFSGAIDHAAVTISRLILRLGEPIAQDGNLQLHLAIQAPNSTPFQSTPGDISSRPVLASTMIDFPVKAGQSTLFITNAMNPLLDAALADPGWIAGMTNSITVLLWQEGGTIAPLVQMEESGQPASLETCSGDCPVEDYNEDGRIIIGCSGDSNTWLAGNWCSQLPSLAAEHGLQWEVINAGYPYLASSAAPYQINEILTDPTLNPTGAVPDVLILAFGTNDVGSWFTGTYGFDGSFENIMNQFAADVAIALNDGMRPLVALPPEVRDTPDCPADQGDRLLTLRDMLAAAYTGPFRIAFDPPFVNPDDLVDCLHLNPVGQMKRAVSVMDVLNP